MEKNVLMIGDAAGMITPLCGNGMSIALHGSKIAAFCIDLFLKKERSRQEMEWIYERLWKKEFSKRVVLGRRLQSFFGSELLSTLFVTMFQSFPFLAKQVIAKTHGTPF